MNQYEVRQVIPNHSVGDVILLTERQAANWLSGGHIVLYVKPLTKQQKKETTEKAGE